MNIKFENGTYAFELPQSINKCRYVAKKFNAVGMKCWIVRF